MRKKVVKRNKHHHDKYWENLDHAPVYPRTIEDVLVSKCRQIDEDDKTKGEKSRENIKHFWIVEKLFCLLGKWSNEEKECEKKEKESIVPHMKHMDVER